MIRTFQPSGRTNNNMTEGVRQVSKSSNQETHFSLQGWQCDQECTEYDDRSAANLLSAELAAARLANSSSDSELESDLLPPDLHNHESGSSLLLNDLSSLNPTANLLLPKGSIWGIGESEYSWAQESLSRCSGSMDDSSLLSSDTLENDASRQLRTSNALKHTRWPLHSTPSAITTMNHTAPLPAYQRRSWQSMSDEDQTPVGLLNPNMNGRPAYSNLFPALSSSLCLDASKFNMDYLAEERSTGNYEATSVYDSMPSKIHNQISFHVANSDGTADLSSMGISALPINQTSTGLAEARNGYVMDGLFLQHKSYSMSPMDHGKTYLTSDSSLIFDQNSASSTVDRNATINESTSNQRFGENLNSSKLLLESGSGKPLLNMSPGSESALGSPDYLFSMQKKVKPLESLRKYPADVGAWGTAFGLKEFSSSSPSVGNLGRFSYGSGSTLGAKEDGQGLHYDFIWPPAAGRVGQQSTSVDLVRDDSRKRFLQMSIGQPNNTSHKRLHMETQNRQPPVPPASLKNSSSWASSLTSTCLKDQDSSVTSAVIPYTNSRSRHAVWPALNTNLKPRARQGSAADPQSIAARVRRERISERLKVLQELVPNVSKVDLVTMLEKAINYVKCLQLQIKVLTTDDYWPSNEKGTGRCTALPNFEDMEGALKTLVAQKKKEASINNHNNIISGSKDVDKLSEDAEMEPGSPQSSDST